MSLQSRPRRLAASGVAGVLVAAVIGCGPHLRTPRWFDPGNAATQRYEAIYHDPYPLSDVGPEVEGARPRGYQAPVPEVARARQARSSGAEMRTVAPPPATRLAP
ncbi:MAG: hypothetical protein AAF805_10270 [Planctomycetota bacterium]